MDQPVNSMSANWTSTATRAPRELFCPQPGKLQWRDIKETELTSTQARVEFRYGAAKHGTERMLYQGQVFVRGDYDADMQLFRRDGARDGFRPYVTGNLAVCEVVEVGEAVTDLAPGDHVLCRGGFRERHVIDTARLGRLDLRKMPAGLSWQSAVCLDPTMFALAALRDGQVRLGDTVAVFGLGALGLAAVQLAKATHVGMLVAVDPVKERRAVAGELGADLLVDPTVEDVAELVRQHNNGRGMDVAIDMSGSPEAIQGAIRATHFGGTVIAAAAPPKYHAGIDLGGDAHFNCLNFVFSRGCSEPNRDHPRWDMLRLYDVAWSMICSGAVSGNRIVDRIVAFDSLADSYEEFLDERRAIKLGVQMGALPAGA